MLEEMKMEPAFIHSENATNVFHPHYAGEIQKRDNISGHFRFVFWGKLGQGNHVIIVTPSFSKISVFKMLSVHTKTKSRHI